MRHLNVASYNVHRCIGTDGRHDPDRVARVLRELNADVIALQEVDCRFHVPHGPDQLSHLAQLTGMNAVSGPVRRRGTAHYGNGLLTRGEVLAVRQIELSVPRCEPRGALDVDIRIGDRELRVVAAHLGLLPFERRRQVRRLIEAVPERPGQRVIVLGDFNEWYPPGRPLLRLHGHFGKTPAHRTFPSRFPLFALDRIWVRPRAALVSLHAHRSEHARLASDHLPVCARIDRRW